MAFFDDLGNIVSKTSGTLSKKAKGFSKPMANNNSVRSVQKELRKLYYELGRKYYLMKTDKSITESDMDSLINQIHTKETELKDLAKTNAEDKRITCKACGAIIPADSAFCPKCGVKIEKEELTNICPGCGAELMPDMRFCIHCGLDLKAFTSPIPEEESDSSLSEEQEAETPENENSPENNNSAE